MESITHDNHQSHRTDGRWDLVAMTVAAMIVMVVILAALLTIIFTIMLNDWFVMMTETIVI